MTTDECARCHVLSVRARYFQEENVRLRERVHTVVDDVQRRYAPDIRALTRYRWLAVGAQQELDNYWSSRYSHVSSLGHTIVEQIIDQREKRARELAAQKLEELADEEGWPVAERLAALAADLREVVTES